jgi:hypothetical protein
MFRKNVPPPSPMYPNPGNADGVFLPDVSKHQQNFMASGFRGPHLELHHRENFQPHKTVEQYRDGSNGRMESTT